MPSISLSSDRASSTTITFPTKRPPRMRLRLDTRSRGGPLGRRVAHHRAGGRFVYCKPLTKRGFLPSCPPHRSYRGRCHGFNAFRPSEPIFLLPRARLTTDGRRVGDAHCQKWCPEASAALQTGQNRRPIVTWDGSPPRSAGGTPQLAMVGGVC